jgi:hypothetical protein
MNERYYYFSSLGFLEQFINSLSDQTRLVKNVTVLNAFQEGIFVSHQNLQSAGLPDDFDRVFNIERYVDSIVFRNENALRSEHPKAQSMSIREILLTRELAPGGIPPKIKEPKTISCIQPIDDFFLPKITSYEKVLLAVRGDPGEQTSQTDIRSPEKYFKNIVNDLAQMDYIQFQYTTIRNHDRINEFKHLIKVEKIRYFSTISKWVNYEDSGVYDVFIPWGERKDVFISLGFNWQGDESLLFRMGPMENLLLLHARNRCCFEIVAGEWIDGIRSDKTVVSIPTDIIRMETLPDQAIQLEFNLRLEKDHTVDIYHTRLNHLKRAIKHMREEIVYITGLMERTYKKQDITTLYLYTTKPSPDTQQDGTESLEIDPALNALLLDYPVRCLKRLLHTRISTNGLKVKILEEDLNVDGAVDLVLDRTLESIEEGEKVWQIVAEPQSDESPTWALPVYYYPGKGMIFDLEPELYLKHNIALFLPRGSILKPILDYDKFSREKVVDLICSASPDVVPQARNHPEQFIFIIFPIRMNMEGEVSLLTVDKKTFDFLGMRIEYFNKALAASEERRQTLAPKYKNLISAWALDNVESLYRYEVLHHTDTAKRWLAVLKTLHEEITKEAQVYQEECARLLEESKHSREEFQVILDQLKHMTGILKTQQGDLLKEIIVFFQEMQAKIEEMFNALPEGVDQNHKNQIQNIYNECENLYKTMRENVEKLDERIASLTDL